MESSLGIRPACSVSRIPSTSSNTQHSQLLRPAHLSLLPPQNAATILGLHAGQTLLVLGAAGGVGVAAVQVC